MAKSLVVVESPAKARTIEKYLGSGYQVKASKGHIRDLPKSKLGVDIDQGFQAHYVIPPARRSVIKELRSAASKAEAVYLATDLDREGEAIAWHIAEALKLNPDSTYRVVFNEITKGAIRDAFEHPGRLNDEKIEAQQARRVLDRLVGYKLSPLLWRKIRKGLSAGRVQSVAVRLVVEREREIEAFTPEEYWRIRATLAPEGAPESDRFVAELATWEGKKFRPASGEDAEAVAAELRQADYTVTDRQVRKRQDKAPPPFITSELQRAASTQLRFSSSRTMRIAQQLYEGVDLGKRGPTALITYMRTDSHHVASSALAACRDYIGKAFGDGYLPEKPHYFSSRAQAQQAHEAIRPTDVHLAPKEIGRHLSDDQRKLYELIWTRFVGSQMKPAVWEVTNLKVAAGRGEFRAVGRTLVYDGHTRLTGVRLGKDEQIIPAVGEGQALDLAGLEPTQHFTQPPPRYSEATLIRKLESLGIGRPSTYAAILSTIEDRGYVEQQKRRYHATDLGKVVTDKLVEHFPNLLNVDFTRHMEEDLDKVETGEMGYEEVLREFWEPFSKSLEAAMEVPELETDIECDKCGKKMVVRAGKRGPFLSCSGYPKCKNAKEAPEELVEKFNEIAKTEGGMKKVMPTDTGRTCPKCGGKLVERMGRYGKFVGCENYPDCKFIERTPPKGDETDIECLAPECAAKLIRVTSRRGVVYYACSDANNCGAMFPADAEGAPTQPPECTECGRPMTLRRSRGEPFLGCSGYPECKQTVSLGPKGKGGGKSGGKRKGSARRRKPITLETDVECDKCGKKMVVRSSRRGPFLACPGYPKCKNAKDASAEQIEAFNAKVVEEEAKREAEADEGENEQES